MEMWVLAKKCKICKLFSTFKFYFSLQIEGKVTGTDKMQQWRPEQILEILV